MADDASSTIRQLCRFCGHLQPRELVRYGPTADIAICLDCAELAVELIRADLQAPI